MVPTHFPKRTHRESAEFVISSIEALGLTLNPTSRLAQMKQVMTEPRADNIIPANDPDIETAREGSREFTLLAFIFDNLNAHPEDSKLRRKVRNMLKDSVQPQDDKRLSRGRDPQFELFVYSVCLSAGLTPVAFEEPDVTCVVGGTKYGIAAKRVKSESTLDDRIKKASRQIERSGLPGIIALDTCLVLNPRNERVWNQMSDSMFKMLYRELTMSFVKKHNERIQELVRGKGVRGLIIHDHQLRLIAKNDWVTESMTIAHSTARKNQRREKEFESFSQRYFKGLPNVEHL